MFMGEVLSVLTQGMKQAFDSSYPVEDFQDLPVGIEYPTEADAYPGIWVDFDLAGDIAIAGIDHREHIERIVNGETQFGEVTRWMFEGSALFTIVTLSALSRVRLMDEVIKIIGFGPLEDRPAFRDFVDTNPLIGITLSTDQIGVRGMDASPGTPWGTDDVVYEVTLVASLRGEFISTPQGTLVPLSAVVVTPSVQS